MFLLASVSSIGAPLAYTSDELKPWMIAAVVGLLLLALVLIIVAAVKARATKASALSETLEATKQEALAATQEKTGPKHAAKK